MLSSRSVGSSLAVVALAVTVVSTVALPASAHTAPLTKSHARTLAKAINLRSSDFPGYSAQSSKPTKSEAAIANTYAKCVGAEPQYVDVTSPAFSSSSGSTFSSATTFVSSLAAVKRDAQRTRSAHGQQCLKQSFVAAAKDAGAPGATVTLTPLAESSASGLDALFGYQITITASVFGEQVALHGYQIDFARGNAEVELDELGAPNLPQSATTKPLNTLIQRAKQQVPAAGLPLKH